MKKFISVILSCVVSASVALSLLPGKNVNALASEYVSNKWTVFCYFCGSNLEEDDSATNDIMEMVETSRGTDLRYVVLCGGSNVDHEYFKTYATFTILIENGRIYKVGSGELRNMGSGPTLSEFLSWGSIVFPSEKSGVIIWDHGAGAIGGCCYDDLFEFDNLTLPEMDIAFQKVADARNKKYDFIAYDCCEMASLELACILEDDADYLVASQDVMPAEGFDYTAITDYIVNNPDSDTYSVCESLCNGYWDSFGNDVPYFATISIMDLNKLDTLMVTLDRYCESVDSSMSSASYSSFRSALNDEVDIDVNMVDLNAFIGCCSDYSDPSSFAMNETVAEFIPYSRHGSSHDGVSGVTLYIPLGALSGDEAEIFEDILPDYDGYTDLIYDITGY